MIASAAAHPGSEDMVLKALREAMQRVAANPIVYRDFRSALNAAVGAYGLRNQARSAQIADLVENVLAGKGIDGYRNFASGLQEVKEEDLQEVAQRIFRMDQAVILRVHGRTE
jgi:predicted Zn-dependent peptidase